MKPPASMNNRAVQNKGCSKLQTNGMRKFKNETNTTCVYHEPKPSSTVVPSSFNFNTCFILLHRNLLGMTSSPSKAFDLSVIHILELHLWTCELQEVVGLIKHGQIAIEGACTLGGEAAFLGTPGNLSLHNPKQEMFVFKQQSTRASKLLVFTIFNMLFH